MRHCFCYMFAAAISLQSSAVSAASTELHFTRPTGTFVPHQQRYVVPVGNLADQLFQKIGHTEAVIEQKIMTEMQNTPEISRFYSTDLNTDNLRLELSYSGTQVLNGKFTGLNVVTRIGIDGIAVLCPTLKLDISVRDIVLHAQYNFFSGHLNGVQVEYQSNVQANCTGMLGLPLVNKAVSYFAADKAKAKVDDMLAEVIQAQLPVTQAHELAGTRQLMEHPTVIAKVRAAERQLAMPILAALDQLTDGMNLAIGLHRNAQGNGLHVLHLDSYFNRPVIYFDPSIRTYNTRLPTAAGSEVRSPADWTAGLLTQQSLIKSIVFHRLTNFPSYPATDVVTLGTCGKACE